MRDVTSPAEIGTLGDLQVDQDMGFQRRMWTIQRVGWGVVALILVAGMLGVFGEGPLSDASARAGDALEVRYGRIERHRSPSTMSVWVSTDLAQSGKVEVWLDREFADRLRIESVTPEPESVETSATRVTYMFEVDDHQSRAVISFGTDQQGMGLQRGAVGVGEGPSVSFRQLVLP